MSQPILIRPEVAHDFADIHEVHRLAFGRDGEAQLVAALRNLAGFDPALSLVADDGAVVGHILFSPIVIRRFGAIPRPALALAPVAVRPEQQRQGIGSLLTSAGLDACRRGGHALVIVVGHADFYPRFGFRSARARGLEVPFPASDDVFMVYEVEPAGAEQSRPDISGMAEYPAPFLDV